MGDFIMWLGIIGVVVGPIWVILHYTTKWKQAPKITQEDEKLLDELYTLARRLEDRVNTVERIVAADNPDFRPGLRADPRPTLSTPDWQPGAATRSPAAQSPYTIDRRN